jgi:hypothetical protein
MLTADSDRGNHALAGDKGIPAPCILPMISYGTSNEGPSKMGLG